MNFQWYLFAYKVWRKAQPCPLYLSFSTYYYFFLFKYDGFSGRQTVRSLAVKHAQHCSVQ